MHSLHPRAKNVLDVCAHELKGVSIGDLGTLEFAISHEIHEAVRDHMIDVNKMIHARADSVMREYAGLDNTKEKV